MSTNCGTVYKNIRQVAIDIKKGYQGEVEFENEFMPRMMINKNDNKVVCSIIPKDPSYFSGFDEFTINPKDRVSDIVISIMHEVVKENNHMDNIEYMRDDTKKIFEGIKRSNGNCYRIQIGNKKIIFENKKSFIRPYFKNGSSIEMESGIPFDSISDLEKIINKAMIGVN